MKYFIMRNGIFCFMIFIFITGTIALSPVYSQEKTGEKDINNQKAVELYNECKGYYEKGWFEAVQEKMLQAIRLSSDNEFKKKAFNLYDDATAKINENYSQIRNWSGPRIGAIGIVDEKSRNELAKQGASFPVVSAFGWQFETRFISGTPEEKVAGLVIFAPMLLGIDQSVLMASINGLIGIRLASEFEFAVGPHMLISPIYPYFQFGIVMAIGHNFKTAKLNFPINISVVLGKDMIRTGLVFGFNTTNH